MANICTTDYRIIGDRAILEKLEEVINSREEVIPNTITSWAGHKLARLGIPHDQSGRCWWSDARIDDNGVLYFFEESAWTRGKAISILQEAYPDLDIYFISEEPGFEIYETNDEHCTFFKERYVLDDDEHGCMYYETLQELVEEVVNLYPEITNINSIDEINDYFNENEICSSVHEFDFVSEL